MREVISPSKLGFHIQYCVNISALQSEERDYAAVFISVITVNITIPGSRHRACFICDDDLPCSHTGMSEAFQEQRVGLNVNQAACVCREGAEIQTNAA